MVDAPTGAAHAAYPTYADLLARTDAPAGSTWGLFPAESERGMADLAGRDAVLAGLGAVVDGQAISLDYALDAFDPPMSRARGLPVHTITAKHPEARDDQLDGFFLQSSTQIDGLRHRRSQGEGFWDGHPDDAIVTGSPTLGVQRWAERPIVGRAVLVDVEGARAVAGRPLDHARGEVLEVEDLDAALAHQGAEVRPGDVVLVHTGWAAWYLGLDVPGRTSVREARLATGFAQRRALPAWLWDHRVATFATDTFAVERLPVVADGEFAATAVDDEGMVHQELIARLGMPLGELWNLHDLAQASRADGRWSSLVVVKPLHLTGGVGSPANATALR
ncbi:MAG: cyclase family protein [Nocardioides alkalitolerans]